MILLPPDFRELLLAEAAGLESRGLDSLEGVTGLTG